MKKIIILVAALLLVGCGKESKPAETFAHSFVENIEVENIEVETIHVEEIHFENVTTYWD